MRGDDVGHDWIGDGSTKGWLVPRYSTSRPYVECRRSHHPNNHVALGTRLVRHHLKKIRRLAASHGVGRFVRRQHVLAPTRSRAGVERFRRGEGPALLVPRPSDGRHALTMKRRRAALRRRMFTRGDVSIRSRSSRIISSIGVAIRPGGARAGVEERSARGGGGDGSRATHAAPGESRSGVYAEQEDTGTRDGWPAPGRGDGHGEASSAQVAREHPPSKRMVPRWMGAQRSGAFKVQVFAAAFAAPGSASVRTVPSTSAFRAAERPVDVARAPWHRRPDPRRQSCAWWPATRRHSPMSGRSIVSGIEGAHGLPSTRYLYLARFGRHAEETRRSTRAPGAAHSYAYNGGTARAIGSEGTADFVSIGSAQFASRNPRSGAVMRTRRRQDGRVYPPGCSTPSHAVHPRRARSGVAARA